VGRSGVDEIRNPKAEIRKKPEARNPKLPLDGLGTRHYWQKGPAGKRASEDAVLAARWGAGSFGLRVSAFFRISVFGFRISRAARFRPEKLEAPHPYGIMPTVCPCRPREYVRPNP
jgi:hypothetical protein